MEILIKNTDDLDESERVVSLVEALAQAGLLTLTTGLLVVTDDPDVGALVARFGRRLDTPPVLALPEPVKKSRKGIGGRRKKVQEPVADTYVNPALANDVPWDADTSVKPVVSTSPEPASVPPPIPPSLAQDLRTIVREAGMKAVGGKRMPKAARPGGATPKAANGAEPSPNGTVYTNPLTGAVITYGEMRVLLADRRVNPREQYVSNRHGLMEVYDKGQKLILVKVEGA